MKSVLWVLLRNQPLWEQVKSVLWVLFKTSLWDLVKSVLLALLRDQELVKSVL